jgi:hypothetical protein
MSKNGSRHWDHHSDEHAWITLELLRHDLSEAERNRLTQHLVKLEHTLAAAPHQNGNDW